MPTALNDSVHRILKPLRRVLIVDANRSAAEGVRTIVEAYGRSTCEVVCDPYEALLALNDHAYDLVLVNHKSPGLDGEKILEEIDEQVDLDPLMLDSGRYISSIPAVLMVNKKFKPPRKAKLHNFNLTNIFNAKELRSFLSLNFAS